MRASGVVALAIVICACSQGQPSSSSAAADANAQIADRKNPFPPTGLVTDAANVLTANQRAEMTQKLAKFESRTRHQMAIVTTPSLGGRDVAVYTKDLANSWGVGRKGINDGIVILIAPTERKVRISVGHGLEERLPNALCQQIIESEMLPSFRRQDYAKGLAAGADALIAHLR
ncbi:TPM domain-containing protein [Novosphingobium taihuense]|uniref:TPM domain-containing protein n=1 Tax=Novosphingobium taihuense TaxID=260085 RepID=UPI0013157B1E|nr:TPM domain-containing protein [Novosphingobium taihuense]